MIKSETLKRLHGSQAKYRQCDNTRLVEGPLGIMSMEGEDPWGDVQGDLPFRLSITTCGQIIEKLS